MPILATEGKKFVPAPAGAHQAVCVDVVDLGVVEVKWQGETKRQHKVNIVWQINEMNDDGKPFLVSKRYTLSLSEKANLRKDLESWRGVAFTAEQLRGFDVEKLVGVNCMLNVVHNESNGSTYANVVAVMRLPKGMPDIQGSNYTRVKDREPASTSQPAERDEHDQRAQITDDDIPF